MHRTMISFSFGTSRLGHFYLFSPIWYHCVQKLKDKWYFSFLQTTCFACLFINLYCYRLPMTINFAHHRSKQPFLSAFCVVNYKNKLAVRLEFDILYLLIAFLFHQKTSKLCFCAKYSYWLPFENDMKGSWTIFAA